MYSVCYMYCEKDHSVTIGGRCTCITSKLACIARTLRFNTANLMEVAQFYPFHGSEMVRMVVATVPLNGSAR